jgi:hypothetical protein
VAPCVCDQPREPLLDLVPDFGAFKHSLVHSILPALHEEEWKFDELDDAVPMLPGQRVKRSREYSSGLVVCGSINWVGL